MDKKRILKKTGLYFIGNLSTKLLSAILVPLYAFYVNAEDLGAFDYSQTLLNIVVPIAFLCVWEAVLKFVLAEEEKDGYLTGYVSTDKIKSVYRDGETSFFVAGDEGLLKYLDKELEEFKLPKKFIRYDSFLPVCNTKRVVKYNLGIYVNGEKFDIPCYNNKTLLQAIEDGGIYIPSKCQVGVCGLCRSELVKGEVKIINDKRSDADKKFNYIHPCSTYPLSDIEIIVR